LEYNPSNKDLKIRILNIITKNLPMPHKEHDVEPVNDEKLPRMHGEHGEAPLKLYWPEGQIFCAVSKINLQIVVEIRVEVFSEEQTEQLIVSSNGE
jgi:hypothetical protein